VTRLRQAAFATASAPRGYGRQALIRRVLTGIAILVLPVALGSQQRDARTVPAPVGSGEITGIVWTAEATPQPMRRAVVSIAGTGIPSMRSVITDETGTFAFGRLSAGTFTITAKKAGHRRPPMAP
jgi:hypothetical protein